jgi:hypothetical protein
VDVVWHQGKSIQDVGEMLWDLVPTARHLLADPAAPDFPIDEPTGQASAFRAAYRDAMCCGLGIIKLWISRRRRECCRLLTPILAQVHSSSDGPISLRDFRPRV